MSVRGSVCMLRITSHSPTSVQRLFCSRVTSAPSSAQTTIHATIKCGLVWDTHQPQSTLQALAGHHVQLNGLMSDRLCCRKVSSQGDPGAAPPPPPLGGQNV